MHIRRGPRLVDAGSRYSLPTFAMKSIVRGRHKSHAATAETKTNIMVQVPCSVMLLRAMLVVRIDEAQPNIRFNTNAVPTMIASGFPPMIRKQSTQLSTVGYRRKNCSKT
jgi:hypothetical protein